MSLPIEIPERIFVKAFETLIKTPFDNAIKAMVDGPGRHIVIEPGCKFELSPHSLKPMGEGYCEFTFAICHECTDDRTHWVTDRLISVSLICEKPRKDCNE